MRSAFVVSGLACVGALGVACGSKTDVGSGGRGDASASSTGGAGGASEVSTSTGPRGGGGSGAGGNLPDPPGTFVAVGVGGRRIRSRDDGVTWTDDVSLGEGGADPTLDLRAVAFGRGVFAAVGFRVMTSSDAVTWQDTPPQSFDQDRIEQLTYGAGLFVGVGDNGSRVSSPDAMAWSQHGIDTTTSPQSGAIAFGKGWGFVSINDDGAVTHSPDGETWQITGASISTNGCAVAFGGGRFVAVGGGSTIVSTNGEEWSNHYVFPANGVGALVFAEGRFAALTFGAVYMSTEGEVWTEHEVPALAVDTAAYGHGTVVAFDATRVRRSHDGVDWSAPVELGGTNAFTAVTFGADAP